MFNDRFNKALTFRHTKNPKERKNNFQNEEGSSPSELVRKICLGWTSPYFGYGRICPHNTHSQTFFVP